MRHPASRVGVGGPHDPHAMTLTRAPRSVVQITVLVLLTECASPITPNAPVAPSVDVAREVFQWTFADPSNGPPAEDSEFMRSRYTPQGLEFAMLKPRSLRFTPRMDSVRDMRVEADFEFTTAAARGDNPPSLGVICRAQPSQWFFLRVVANGGVSAYRIRGENAEDWLRVPGSGPQTAIASGPVHVRADCFSDASGTIFLSFYVNACNP